MESTDEVPDWAKVWLDDDVARWLHEQAKTYFNGDVELTLNEMLRIPMAMKEKPEDPWAGIQAQQRARERGAYEGGRRHRPNRR